jgi:putative N6-adenine-specific DNA methylase
LPDELLTRGGRKLEAAIERFRLAPRIANAAAIDVGASTGGFTAALLRHGATRVVAVDVGRDQLHPSLREDKRIERLEGVHFRTLPLDAAPGPFDFFTVDVSFVAARTMLRGLAFRLRDGAEGVVLVKPQFELADKLVKGGDVRDAGLRKKALDAVREKAETLGFELVEAVDSPVAGGSGTVEILAHLRFRGRSERMPKRGEKKAPAPARPKPAATLDGPLRLFAVAAPGLEAVVAAEATKLAGTHDVREVPGGVELRGNLATLLNANRGLRVASRVLVRLGQAHAENFAQLRHFVAKLPWKLILPPDRPVAVRVSQRGSRLYHTGAIAETVMFALSDALGWTPQAVRPSADEEEETPAQLILLRGERNEWTVSVDSSGALLHRRGWRLDVGAAPLRETLAAGLLALADWQPSEPLWDPMCGSGTFAIEAALLALGRAPGEHRRFALQSWPAAAALAIAQSPSLSALAAPIGASDARAEVIADARANATRAGVAELIQLDNTPLEKATPPPGRGLVVANPPYGRRLGGDIRAVYRSLGRRLREVARGWRAGILVPGERAVELSRALGITVDKSLALRNGGLSVRFLVGKI